MRTPASLLLACAIAALAVLQGCATPATGPAMASMEPARVQAAPDHPMRNGIYVGEVIGGSDTNPMWMSKIGNPEFKQALELSLKSAGLHNPAPDAPYRLNAQLVSIDQPMFGFDMTVTLVAQYAVDQKATGTKPYAKGISASFTAKVSDAFLGVERLRVANEGAVRENIRKLIDDLLAYKPAKK